MKMPLCNLLSLAVPALVGSVGYYLARTAKGATNLGEALGPFFGWLLCLFAAAMVGEGAALLALVRGERLAWLSWLGAVANGLLLLTPLVWLAGHRS
jgi:hypothetical protein